MPDPAVMAFNPWRFPVHWWVFSPSIWIRYSFYSLSIAMQNPALRQEPRYEPASVIPLKQGESLLYWLESNGRLLPREGVLEDDTLEDSEEEIAELMDVEDDDDDDDLDD